MYIEKTLNTLSAELGIFADPMISKDSVIHETCALRSWGRYLSGGTEAKYQMKLLSLFAPTETVKTAKTLEADLLHWIDLTLEVFTQIFKVAESKEELENLDGFFDLTAQNLIEQAIDVYRIFNAAKANYSILREHYLSEITEVDQAYKECYDHAIESANQVSEQLMEKLHQRIIESKLHSYFDFSSLKLKSGSSEIEVLSQEEYRNLHNPGAEFRKVMGEFVEAMEKQVERLELMVTTQELEIATREAAACKKIYEISKQFLTKLDEFTAEPLGKIFNAGDEGISLEFVTDSANGLKEAFRSNEGRAFLTEVTNLTMGMKLEALVEVKTLLAQYDRTISSSCFWQERVYQLVTPRMSMPLKALLEQCQQLRVSEEVQRPISDVLKQLRVATTVANTFSR